MLYGCSTGTRPSAQGPCTEEQAIHIMGGDKASAVLECQRFTGVLVRWVLAAYVQHQSFVSRPRASLNYFILMVRAVM